LIAAYCFVWWSGIDLLYCMGWPLFKLQLMKNKCACAIIFGVICFCFCCVLCWIGLPSEGEEDWNTDGRSAATDFLVSCLCVLPFCLIGARGNTIMRYCGLIHMGKYALGAYILNSIWDLSIVIGGLRFVPGFSEAVTAAGNWVCSDSKTFMDAKGLHCDQWVGRCGSSYWHYTAAEIQDVHKHCLSACNECPTSGIASLAVLIAYTFGLMAMFSPVFQKVLTMLFMFCEKFCQGVYRTLMIREEISDGLMADRRHARYVSLLS